MPPLTLLIKPASSNCNLSCRYCFYDSLTNKRVCKSYGMMTQQTLEILVKRAFEYATEYCNFNFQGGEPTLIGLDFYIELIRLQKKYNVHNIAVANAIQTNATLITPQMAQFFYENDFLVGVSLDGTKDINDINRVTHDGNGTFTAVKKGIGLLDKYNVKYNVLSVVSKASVKKADSIYSYFAKCGFKYLQFIPCIDEFDSEFGSAVYSVTPEEYGDFLIILFNRWYKDIIENRYVSIRYFDNLVGILMGHPPEECGMSGRCSVQCVIEANLNMYPCDFYARDEWLLGNLNESDFGTVLGCEKANEFVKGSCYVDDECKNCRYVFLCRGGCRRYKEPFIDAKPQKSYLCNAYKKFYNKCYERLLFLAKTFATKNTYR